MTKKFDLASTDKGYRDDPLIIKMDGRTLSAEEIREIANRSMSKNRKEGYSAAAVKAARDWYNQTTYKTKLNKKTGKKYNKKTHRLIELTSKPDTEGMATNGKATKAGKAGKAQAVDYGLSKAINKIRSGKQVGPTRRAAKAGKARNKLDKAVPSLPWEIAPEQRATMTPEQVAATEARNRRAHLAEDERDEIAIRANKAKLEAARMLAGRAPAGRGGVKPRRSTGGTGMSTSGTDKTNTHKNRIRVQRGTKASGRGLNKPTKKNPFAKRNKYGLGR